MEASNWITLASVLSTVTLAIVTIVLHRHRDRVQQERDDANRAAQQQREDSLRREAQDREDKLRAIESVHEPHIEFSVECAFFGPQAGSYAMQILLIVENKGRVQQRISSMILRLRGIDADQELTFREDERKRLCFPLELIKNEQLVTKDVGYFFVEPGVRQSFAYFTSVPTSTRFLLVYSRFQYADETEKYHTVQRMLSLPSEPLVREHDGEE